MKELNRKNIAGIWSAMPTPFTNELELDTESISHLVEHYVRLGIKGLFLASPNGEGHLMTDSMQMELAAEVVKGNQDRMLLSMMIADNPAKLMIDNIKCIEDCGIDIATINFPFPPIGIEHKYLRKLYLSVLEQSSLPIALCHIGMSTSLISELSLLEPILLHPKVVLVKDCSSNPIRTRLFIETFLKNKKELIALAGNELECISYAESGYDGFLLNSACFTGFIANTMLEFAKAGRIKDAREIQEYMNSMLVEVFGLDLNNYLVGQKQMMVELGIVNTAKTLQDYPISDECRRAIKRIVQEEKEFLLPDVKAQSED